MRAFLILAVTLTSATAQAATLTTTGTFTGSALAYDPTTDFSPFNGYNPPSHLGGFNGLITLSGFNPALGTLNSITITEHAAASLEFKQADPYTTSETLNASVFSSGVSPFGDHDIELPYTFFNPATTPFQTYDTGVQYNDSGPGTPFVDTTIFTPFLTPTIYVPVLGYVTLGPSTGSYIGQPTSTFSYTMTFAYDYTPSAAAPTPEPAAWAMMIGGFGLVGAAMRRRGRRTAAPDPVVA